MSTLRGRPALIYKKNIGAWVTSRTSAEARTYMAARKQPKGTTIVCPSCFTRFQAADAVRSERVFTPAQKPFAVCPECHKREVRNKVVFNEWN